jgi:hypothetical protein
MVIVFSLKFVLYVTIVSKLSVDIGSQENEFIAASTINKVIMSQYMLKRKAIKKYNIMCPNLINKIYLFIYLSYV